LLADSSQPIGAALVEPDEVSCDFFARRVPPRRAVRAVLLPRAVVVDLRAALVFFLPRALAVLLRAFAPPRRDAAAFLAPARFAAVRPRAALLFLRVVFAAPFFAALLRVVLPLARRPLPRFDYLVVAMCSSCLPTRHALSHILQ